MLLYLTKASMLITVSMRRRRARHRKRSVSRASDRPECESTVMMFRRDDLEIPGSSDL
jgi:hypothetical protein